jgi:uncharacterized protein DUF697
MSKTLPKTSKRTFEDLRNAAGAALRNEERSASRQPDQGAAPGQSKTSSPPAAAMVPTARYSKSTQNRNFRKAAATQIVERHANFAALAGLVPMPWVDLAAITVVADRMLRKLARLYGVPLDQQRSKQFASAMLTGMAAPGIASFTTTGLLRMTPGPHLLGMALTSISAAILLRVVGDVYISHLSSSEFTSYQPDLEAQPAKPGQQA